MSGSTKQITEFAAASQVSGSDFLLLQQGPTNTPYSYAPVASALGTLTFGQVTGALGYTPTSNIGSGSVTSVGITVPGALLTAAGSPITGAGTLALSLQTQAASNLIFASPSGASGIPAFRALVPGDLPAPFTSLATFAGGLTASGTASGTAYQLSALANVFTTVAATSGCRLPASGAVAAFPSGVSILILNWGANLLPVWPPASGQVNSLGENASAGIATGGGVNFLFAGGSQWYTH